jgi:hypothetical protein
MSHRTRIDAPERGAQNAPECRPLILERASGRPIVSSLPVDGTSFDTIRLTFPSPVPA